jgi:hypothetical protein
VLRSRPITLLVAGAVGALFIAGLFVHGHVGAVLLLAVAVVLVTLSAAAWPSIPERGRRVRIGVVAVVVVLAVVSFAR